MTDSKESSPPQILNLRDPLLVLPPEIFCKSLSFLPPACVTNSNAVSRNWRAVNLSDASLYSELDLLDPNWQIESAEGRSEEERERKEMDFYFYHADLLASRANHRCTKVSIHLTCFVRGFQQAETEGVSSESKLVEFFYSILCLSSQSLEEIRVRLELPSPDTTEKRHDNIKLLRHFIEMIKWFPNLKLFRLDLEGHSFVDHLEAGDYSPGSKKLIIRKREIGLSSQSQRILALPSAIFIAALSKDIRANFGTLIRLDLDTTVYQGTPFDIPDQELIQELEKSKSTLQTLRLPEYIINSYQGWLLLMNCPNLQMSFEDSGPTSGISLDLTAEEWEGVTLEEVESLKSFPNVHLNSLARWETMLRWLGNGRGLSHLRLVSFKKEEEDGTDNEDPPFSPLSLGSILFNSTGTLKHLHLCGVGTQGHQHLIESSPIFPKLRSLHLVDTPQLWPSFSNLTSPQLDTLFIGSLTANYNLQVHQLAFDCLVSLSTSHKSILRTLKFKVSATSPTPETLKFPGMSSAVVFSQLNLLILEDSGCNEWFSNFQYPVLTTLVSEVVDHLDQFRKNAPSLQVVDKSH